MKTSSSRAKGISSSIAMAVAVALLPTGVFAQSAKDNADDKDDDRKGRSSKDHREQMTGRTPPGHAVLMIGEGRRTFRSDTFGDEEFWGDTLKLHQAIAGGANGGVGEIALTS